MTEMPTRRRRQRRFTEAEAEAEAQLGAPVLQGSPAPQSQPPSPERAAQNAIATDGATRELSSLERARLRAAELLEHGNEQLDNAIDEFAIPAHIIPEGWHYEWRTHTVQGKEDASYAVQLDMKGWQPVPVSRHPNMMPKDYSGSTIILKGMMLMERPVEINERMRMLEKRRALDQVRIKEDQLRSAPPGTFDRGQHPGAPVKVGRNYEPIPVPKN